MAALDACLDGADSRQPASSAIGEGRPDFPRISAIAKLARARNLGLVDGTPLPAAFEGMRMSMSSRHRTLLSLACAALVAVAALDARASDMAERVRLLLDERLAGTAGEIEVSVGDPDPRLRLAPCARMEPFVPSGARLLGRTSLGVRCTEGANWVVYVPVQIRLFVDAWVAARPIPRGVTIGPDDVRLDRVDVAPLNGNAVPPDVPLIGRTALRAVAPGEPLRRDALRSPPVVQPGDAVQVMAVGTGFAAQSPGKALTAAADGQTAQVALPGGKVLSGIARPGGIVEVR
jgi:flagella basal body P-ring formation protein FlgA